MIATAVLAIGWTPARAFADCGRAKVTVIGNPEEETEACAAIEDVLRHFAGEREAFDISLTIRFQRSVFMETTSSAFRDAAPIAVSGFYHVAKNEIRMTSSNAEWAHKRRPWKLPWDGELAYSILRHEVAHAIIYQMLGENHRKLPRAWHEALAYAVQFELMRPELRERILAQYADREAFASTLHINDFVYGADPDGFAVSAYRTYARDGGMAFLRRALRFELEMIDLNDLP